MNKEATFFKDVFSNLAVEFKIGKIWNCKGILVEAIIPGAFIGELCEIETEHSGKGKIYAEVVGFRQSNTLLMTYVGNKGVSKDNKVIALGRPATVKVGDSLLGRVIDGFGTPLDNKPNPAGLRDISTSISPINPLTRKPIVSNLRTGVRAIDALNTIGIGQRVGLFAGSGVGKSTLISRICRNSSASVNVIALIGERGREVEEFVNRTLKGDLTNTVVIAATAQESPLMRVHATYSAITIAEYFARNGKDVLFTMDSITRFATALREVGLAGGEPPTVKGYTPSVFSSIPDIIERCGNFLSKGSITGVFTVLVDSDDFNDPVVDCARSILDGHIVLTRQLAEQGHFPAIDISKSVSRLFGEFHREDYLNIANQVKNVFSDYQQNREIIELQMFDNGLVDGNIQLKNKWNSLKNYLCQNNNEHTSFEDAKNELEDIFKGF